MPPRSARNKAFQSLPEFLILIVVVMAIVALLCWQIASGRGGDDLTRRVVRLSDQWSAFVQTSGADRSSGVVWDKNRTIVVEELAPLVKLEPKLKSLVDDLTNLPLVASTVAQYGIDHAVFDQILFVLEEIRHRQTGSFEDALFFALALGGLGIGFLVWRTQQLHWLASIETVLAAKAQQRGQIEEHERWRIARELHDGVAQEVARAKLCFESLNCGGCLQTENQTIRGTILESLSLSIKEIRWLCGILREAASSETSLDSVLERTAGEFRVRYGLPTRVHRVNSLGINWDQSSLYEISRMVQEGLTNVARHSGASNVIVRSVIVGAMVKVQVEDDGSGIRSAEGLGMKGVRERAELLNGSAQWDQLESGGTRMTITIPLPPVSM